eukprot:TRINITY_DN42842_c0_g1_i1.p1 TRINITY_DN42842_c0_g1~~TRINITY_DN42842_c0_g1_i1.p1  ORF type:complete len:677 (+),score=101.90 TRINITY_DN42842_c0_g1_i1:120-2150(+)
MQRPHVPVPPSTSRRPGPLRPSPHKERRLVRSCEPPVSSEPLRSRVSAPKLTSEPDDLEVPSSSSDSETEGEGSASTSAMPTIRVVQPLPAESSPTRLRLPSSGFLMPDDCFLQSAPVGHIAAGLSKTVCDSPTVCSSEDVSPIRWRHLRKGLQEGSVRDQYTWREEDELGRGSFGRVFRGNSCYHSSKVVAVKQLARASVDNVDKLWSEIHILCELDHPNILRFLEAYEDSRHFYIVTEICLGGSLDEWLVRAQDDLGFVNRVAQEVLGVLAHCHERAICHRDLKLDNILLLRDSIDSPTRVADFGLAKLCSSRIMSQRLAWNEARASALGGGYEDPRAPKSRSKASRFSTSAAATAGTESRKVLEEQPPPENPKKLARMKSVAGTPEYMAPEVVHMLHRDLKDENTSSSSSSLPGFYDFRCDVWSLGVVLYTMICNRHPYDLEEMSEFVAEGKPLPELAWNMSQPAQSFIQACLEPDFRRRPHARELLLHPWLKGASGTASHMPTPSSTSLLVERFRSYAGLSELKRAAMLAAVRHLGAYEHEHLRALFQKVDTHNVGEVSLSQMMKVLQASPASPTSGHKWVEKVVQMIDSEKTGKIAYTEFLAAVMDPNIEDRKDLALAAFRGFDLDGSGSLSHKELRRVIESCDKDLIDKGDTNGDGELDFEEFVDLLRKG